MGPDCVYFLLLVIAMFCVTESYLMGYRFRRGFCRDAHINRMTYVVGEKIGYARAVSSALGMVVSGGNVNKSINARPMERVAPLRNRAFSNSLVSGATLMGSPTRGKTCSRCYDVVQRFVHSSLLGSQDVSSLSQGYISALSALGNHCGGKDGVYGLYCAQLSEAFARAVVARGGGGGGADTLAPSTQQQNKALPSGEWRLEPGGAIDDSSKHRGLSAAATAVGNAAAHVRNTGTDSGTGRSTGRGGDIDGNIGSDGDTLPVAVRGAGDHERKVVGRVPESAESANTAHKPPPKVRRLVREGNRYVYR